MDDYYSGAEGARRLLEELDQFLQWLLDNVEPAESIDCSIALRLTSGERVDLVKTYSQTTLEAPA